MERIRILIVDDSIVVRRLLSEALGSEPALEVVGTASSGCLALAKIPQVNPDLVTLDVEMPELDGLATLREIRRLHPRLPVVMFSTSTERGASATIDALSQGANDYVTKPANVGSIDAGLEQIRRELIPKIRALVGSRAPIESARPPAGSRGSPAGAAPAGPVEVVAIGTSTGGPNALAQILPLLPAGFPVPILVVQHMPPMFTRLLAENLAARSRLPIAEARSGEPLEPGRVWIAPGDHHLTVAGAGERAHLRTNQNPHENSCRPSVDVLFRSVAATFGPRALGVILTGMGQDGLRGAEAIRARGGRILVQDEASSVVWGMAGSVARAGLADEVLPLPAIAHAILRRVGRRTPTSGPGAPAPR